MLDFKRLLPTFNPWWRKGLKAFGDVPAFKRPILHAFRKDLLVIPQIISIIGPRRIGKTTLVKQLIADLIEQGTDPKRIVYYSMDDPALILNHPEEIAKFIEHGMERVRSSGGEWYFFLDEIQRLEGWELYLKKYYDLKYPVRFVISGSASSPIFQKSRESLLGRIKNYHLLPFSFREFALFRAQHRPEIIEELETLHREGSRMQEIFAKPPKSFPLPKVPSESFREFIDQCFAEYLLEGGFPEVWSLPSLVAKQEYLFDNQVRKVIDEDLVLAVELRKPELLKKFYLSLLAMPGAETTVHNIAKETGINVAQIEKYLPLLEMTDLLFHVSKFRSGSLTVRKGNMKFYACDLALRNAVLRVSAAELRTDDITLGRYAENLVYLTLKQWSGPLQIDFFRERNEEIDFIVHYGAGRFFPIEVKYQNSLSDRDGHQLRKFAKEYPCLPLLITKNWSDFGHDTSRPQHALKLPLPLFLLLFS